MKNPTTKFERLLAWINQLTSENEFSIAEAMQATKLPNSTIQIILPSICKKGLMERKEKGKSLLYRKTPSWNLELAIKANHERLEIKYKKSAKCLNRMACMAAAEPIAVKN